MDPGRVPPTIHRYWSGPVIPSYVPIFGAALREIHPDWEVHEWTFDALPADVAELCRESVLRVRGHEAARHVANIVRYWVLYEQGGIWVDSDVMPLRSFAPLLGDHPVFATLHGGVEGAFIASPAGHPVMRAVLDRATTVGPAGGSSSVHVSGAGVLDSIVPLFPDVELLPERDVYSTDAYGNRIETDPSPGGPYADHLWASSRLAATRNNGSSIDLRPERLPQTGPQDTAPRELVDVIPAVSLRPVLPADEPWIAATRTEEPSAVWTTAHVAGRHLPHIVHLAEQPVGVVAVEVTNTGTRTGKMRYSLDPPAAEFIGEVLEHMGFLSQQHLNLRELTVAWPASRAVPIGLARHASMVTVVNAEITMWSTCPEADGQYPETSKGMSAPS